jgi:hypothetical protein
VTNPFGGFFKGTGFKGNGGVACLLQFDTRLDQSERGNPRQTKWLIFGWKGEEMDGG